jgi:hypothetical protein
MAVTSLSVLLALSTLAIASAYDRPAAVKDFGKIDVDSSGHATDEEVGAHLDRQYEAEMDAWIQFYDTNADGKVEKKEYFSKPKSNQGYWETVDLNTDE